jgi:hypothetical protein
MATCVLALDPFDDDLRRRGAGRRGSRAVRTCVGDAMGREDSNLRLTDYEWRFRCSVGSRTPFLSGAGSGWTGFNRRFGNQVGN